MGSVIYSHNKYAYIHIYKLDTYRRNNKRRAKSSFNMYFSLYCKGSKRLLKVCVWEGAEDRTKTAIYWLPLLWPSALCLSRSPGLLNQRPRGPLCWVRVFSPASCHQRVSKHHRGSRGPLRPGVAFPTTSYQQLIRTPTQSGAPRAPSAWCGFPNHISSLTPTVL